MTTARSSRAELPLGPGATSKKPKGAALYAFVLFQMACQLVQLTPAIGALRPVVRTAAFATSLLCAVFLPGSGERHPAARAAFVVLGIMGLSMLHPHTNGVYSGFAQIALYASVLGPLFWVPRLNVDERVLRNMIALFAIFHGVSAGLGVLQTYFPGQFQPTLSSVIAAKEEGYLESLHFTLASGERALRPMGLTDTPGGASMAGFYAILFGVGFMLATRNLFVRVACAVLMTVGATCLYLSQVRSVLVMLVICLLIFISLSAAYGRFAKAGLLFGALLAAMTIGFLVAVDVGGASVVSRFGTLFENDPTEVYRSNRGHFLEYTIETLLPEYPLGAGLGRWGMIYSYFGDRNNPDSTGLWVEIQWTGWLFDGGVPLILAYCGCLALALTTSLRIAASRAKSEMATWGTLIFAHTVGCVAFTFSYAVFISQTGLELWLLNAVLFAASRHHPVPAEAANVKGANLPRRVELPLDPGGSSSGPVMPAETGEPTPAAAQHAGAQWPTAAARR